MTNLEELFRHINNDLECEVERLEQLALWVSLKQADISDVKEQYARTNAKMTYAYTFLLYMEDDNNYITIDLLEDSVDKIRYKLERIKREICEENNICL